jgi:hypothetical protein
MDLQSLITIIWAGLIIKIVVILIIIGLSAWAKEKAKNLATKSEVEELTRKIETVKSEIAVQQVGEVAFRSEKRKALIDFCQNWLSVYSYVHSDPLHDHNLEASPKDYLFKTSEFLYEKYRIVNNDAALLELYYFDDTEMNGAVKKLIDLTSPVMFRWEQGLHILANFLLEHNVENMSVEDKMKRDESVYYLTRSEMLAIKTSMVEVGLTEHYKVFFEMVLKELKGKR